MNTDSKKAWTIKQLTDLYLGTESADKRGRLLLPPIQRSVIWSNQQVINYWDSLLRGYPAGMMMIHQPLESQKGRSSDGSTTTAHSDDLMLFDGQQRMMAILLGRGEGQLALTRRLWVELGQDQKASQNFKFQLRMTSTGQPLGYKADAPNQSFELHRRSDKWEELCKEVELQNNNQRFQKQKAVFDRKHGGDIIDSTCAIPLAEVWAAVESGDNATDISTLAYENQRANFDHDLARDFVRALREAMKAEILLQVVPAAVVSDPAEYIRFFQRVGQGGTRLSEDELCYSIMKHEFPYIHDRMEDIAKKSGRLTDEVDLVLASLRTAKTTKIPPWKGATEGEIVSRPNPDFVSKLRDREKAGEKVSEKARQESLKLQGVRQEFLKLVPETTSNKSSSLYDIVSHLRDALSYHSENQPEGLPPILLGCLPRGLVEVIIRFAVIRGPDKSWEGSDDILRAFVIYWLLFVWNDSKAALFTFQVSVRDGWTFSKETARLLVQEFEKEGVSRQIFSKDLVEILKTQISEDESCRLRPYAERFAASDRKL